MGEVVTNLVVMISTHAVALWAWQVWLGSFPKMQIKQQVYEVLFFNRKEQRVHLSIFPFST